MAKQVRTRLAPRSEPVPLSSAEDSRAPSALDGLYYGKAVRDHVREFGIVFCFVLSGIAGLRAWRGHSLGVSVALLLVGVTLYLLGRVRPAVLVPAWRGWMWIGAMLGLIVTPIVLGVLWWIMVVPLAMMVRVLGIKVLDLRFRAPVDSYWKERDSKKNDMRLLERQF